YLDKKLEAHLKLDWYNEQAVKSEARRQANQPVSEEQRRFYSTWFHSSAPPQTLLPYNVIVGPDKFRHAAAVQYVHNLGLFTEVVSSLFSEGTNRSAATATSVLNEDGVFF
ncbi:unnamed protein product, partial [Pylaiella littoralis]